MLPHESFRMAAWGKIFIDLPIYGFDDLLMNSRPDCPLKIRGQVLPPCNTGVMIFSHF